jgi:two-component system CheB/CheR fusion protein
MSADKKTEVPPVATPQDFPVVGIGASAGGLDAFRRLLKAIPDDSGMAYVLVQHLDPLHESILPEILSRVTAIPVSEITDDIHLTPNHIYVIPANKILKAFDGVLKLTPRDTIKTNLAIDVFFTSLADVHKELAVGIVLSGKGDDGTLGLKAIKEHGGVSFAQDQETAAYGDMPQSAVNAGVVDFVLTPEEMPAKLREFARDYHKSDIGNTNEEIPKEDETAFKSLIVLLQERSGVDFTYYKQNTIRRRIARRMAIGKVGKLADYLNILMGDKTEQQALFQDLLIPVTSFFRDPNTFEALREKVLPALFKNKAAEEPVRIWIAGCSTGEEAFSMAICLHEFLGEQSPTRQIQIFASDISEIAIKKARAGIYTKAEVQTLSNEQLSLYFSKTSGNYQVVKTIRDLCVFAVQNFLKDPPFSKIDLISCRNVLIYMDSFLQKKALSTFHYALRKNGFLLLGKSETTSVVSDLFASFIRTEKIYSRKSVPGRFLPVSVGRREDALVKKDKKTAKPDTLQADFRKTAESILLAKYTPAGVIVNDLMDVVHIHGAIAPFLEPPPGKPTFNLFKMAREGLGFELRNVLHKAKTSPEPVIKTGIPVQIHGVQHLVTIEILLLTSSVEPHFLILFTKTETASGLTGDLTAVTTNDAHLRIQQLENELAQTREDMRSIIEDQEVANEELQSTSEELESSSEEMQSLNEELETSKEELESSNEELVILNQELLDKQEQLNVARLYSEAIVTSIREPLVILDKSLRIKTANLAFYKKFNFTELETEDKLFYELQNHQWDDQVLQGQLEKIIPQRVKLENFEITLPFPVLGERTMLLNARQVANEHAVEPLILLAIEDITERKVAEQKLKTFSEDLEIKVKERTADLQLTNEKLQQFAHAASHDLQEPLRKIVTFSNRLQEKHEDEFSLEAKTYLSKIAGASARMSKLIQDLLNYSQLLNHEKLFAPTDLGVTLENVLSDFEVLIEQKKALITSGLLPTMEAIPLQMNQLFYNLISNALKFSREGTPPVLAISSKLLTPETISQYPTLNPSMTYCELIFKDNGIGFEQKYGQQVFVLFQRLNQPGQYQGTGIGLSLSKKIVEIHHGEIFVEATETDGAAFHIILPIKQFNPVRIP